MILRFLMLMACALLLGGAALAAEKRVALVIGNNDYEQLPKLNKAANDAEAVARELAKIGFEVIAVTNANQRKMNSAINSLIDKAAGGGVAIFFYAGHGLQINNQNFLAPVDMEMPKSQNDVGDQAINLQTIQDKLANAKAKFTLLVIDACRNNPLPQQATRSLGVTRGLAQPSAPNGQVVLFSAGAHQEALDALSERDTSPNGLFTREFLPTITTPGISATEALRRVRSAVIQKAKSVGHEQHPALYDQTDGDFYFVAGAPPAAAAGAAIAVQATTAAVDASLIELEYWKGAQQAHSIEAYQSYLKKYPKGQYAELATANINRLKSAAPTRAADSAAIELAVWESVNSSGEISEYQDYLRQYPHGRFAVVAKNRLQSLMTHRKSSETTSQALDQAYSQAMQGDSRALAQLRQMAEQGNAEAQAKFGFMYEYGRGGLSKDRAEAARWYRKAAEQGLARAQAGLGSFYLYGLGGLLKDEVEALKWLRKAADQGDDRAQNAIGRMYQRGLGGLAKDEVEALKWYRKAAEQDSPYGQNSLGGMYANGLGGLPKDEAQAVKWYRLAAEQGSAPAQRNLGGMYENGRGGLTKDEAEALKWYRRAAEQGNGQAQVLVGLAYLHARAGLSQDESEALRWFRQAAEQDHEGGQFHVGLMYELGRGGLTQNEAEAAKWYRKAADQDHPLAQKHLARMYATGRGGLTKDLAEASRWWEKSRDGSKPDFAVTAQGANGAAARSMPSKSVDQLYQENESGVCKGKPFRFLCQSNLKAKLCKEHNAYGKPNATICPTTEPTL